MAFVIADRVRETTTSTGTGSVTLAGAYTSFQTFSAAIGNGNNTYYTIASASSGEWEVGIGTYSSGGNLLSRDTVLASSNGGSLVTFTSGAKDVFVTQPSERSLLINAASNGLFAGNAAFTANGVPYANSTSTLTTGSALTFDGTGALALANTGNVISTIQSTSTVGARSATLRLNVANTSGDDPAGAIAFTYGAGFTAAASIEATSTPNILKFLIGATEQMRLTSTGLGIGTSSPTEKLSVNGGIVSTFAANLSSGAGAYLYYTSGTTSAELTALNPGVAWLNQKYNALTHIWNSSGSEQMRLTSTGLGIGTSSPGGRLSVKAPTGNGIVEVVTGSTTADSIRLSAGGSVTNWLEYRGYLGHVWFDNVGERMRLDSSGNLGLGVTPSAWTSGYSVLQTAGVGSFVGASQGLIGTNLYVAAGPQAKFIANGYAPAYTTVASTGQHIWYTTGNNVSGAGANATLTQAMTLDASGKLLLGTTSLVANEQFTMFGAYAAFANASYTAYLGAAASILNSGSASDFAIRSNNNLVFSAGGATERARIDSSGNLGLGVTPSAWSGGKALQVGTTTSLWFDGSGSTYYGNNFYYNSGFKYTSAGRYATAYLTTDTGQHQWLVTQSAQGANNPITFTQAMTLDASGNLGIGTSSPGSKLHIDGNFIRIEQSGANTAYFGNAADLITGAPAGAAIRFNNTALRIAYSSTQIAMFDSSGNLGLGVTPSAWSQGKAFEMFAAGYGLWNGSGAPSSIYMMANTYYNGGFKYGGTGQASHYYQYQGAHVWSTAASGTAGNAISFTQAMTLDPSGNLGVGTTSPQTKLHVAGEVAFWATGNDAFRAVPLATGSGSKFLSTNSANTAYAPAIIDGSIVAFQTAGTESARITSGGDLLVQATSSSVTSGVGHKIRPDAAAPFMGTVGSSTSGADVTYSLYSTGAAAYRFYVGYNGTISATTTTISGISDVRLKENIRDLDDGLAAVMALKPRKFDWKAGKGKDIKDDRGFIAQEFEQVFPDMIDEWKDPAPEGEEPYKAVNANLIPTLVKALQEMKEIVDAQAARIAALEAK